MVRERGKMTSKRKQYTAAFKVQVALAALKGDKTINELGVQFRVHPNLIRDWKSVILQGAEQLFATNLKVDTTAQFESQKAELFEQIGHLKMELEWLKKKLDHSAEEYRALIDADHPELSVRRQCQLLALIDRAYITNQLLRANVEPRELTPHATYQSRIYDLFLFR